MKTNRIDGSKAARSPTFRDELNAELARRCSENPRYSLRAFARFLRVDHATLSQILRGRRRVTAATVRRLGARLGFDARRLDALVEALEVERRATGTSVDLASIKTLTTDTVDALSGWLDWAILELTRVSWFVPDVRFIARVLDSSVDDVQLAVQRLARLGFLQMRGRDRWTDTRRDVAVDAAAFGAVALEHLAEELRRLSSRSHVRATSPKGIEMGNPVVQWQIVTTSPDATAKFYADVFGWRIDTNNALGYRAVDTSAEEGIDGGIWPAPPGAPTFVQLFMEVDDVAKKLEDATRAGAKVIVPPQVLPDGDEMAVLQDPVGMAFGVVKRARD